MQLKMLRSIFLIFIFSCFEILANGYRSTKVGIILKKEEADKWQILETVLTSGQSTGGNGNAEIQLIKETVDVEDSINYHRAFCNLLDKEIDAVISSTVSPYYSVLSAYAREYHIPLISPDLPQEISQFPTNYSFGIKPVTSRPMLKLFQQYGWSDIIYLYDHDDGPENLNLIFTVGKHVLNLTLDGILRVTSAKEANRYLRTLDKSFKSKFFHVVLDTELEMARDILWLHVNDIHVRKKNFHFLFPKPTLEDFWIPQKAAFGAINVTAFLVHNQLTDAENVINHILKEPEKTFDISLYYYYDAALVLKDAVSYFSRLRVRETTWHGNCLDATPNPRPHGPILSRMLKQTRRNGTTGLIQLSKYHENSAPSFLNITEITPQGFKEVAFWRNGNLYPVSSSRKTLPTALPLIQTNGRLQIVSMLYPPYMMLKDEGNGSKLQGNDRFEGYCKDIIDLLAKHMEFEYDLHIAGDGEYGRYDQLSGKWSGIIGELIQGKADLAVADLTITGERQRVVEFTDPFEMVGFSLVMKNPRFVSKLSHILFFLSAFTADVWICIIFAVILFCVLFHFITKFTGAPDSIESASGIWGRKHAVIVNIWFAIGSSMFQGTGVYPRSISSRILTGFCWFFTLILSSLFIASVTSQILNGRLSDQNSPQLKQIKSLSMESIIEECVSRGWPKIGVVQPSNTGLFIKKSSIPTLVEFAKYLENNPDLVVSTEEEGIKRVRESSGDYVVLIESLIAEYAIRRQPCDIIATHDSIHYTGYGLATPLGSDLMPRLNEALHIIQGRGQLGELHRKWWIDSSECKNPVILDKEVNTVHVISGLLCFSAIGFLVVLGVFAIQYIRRNQNKESRRQQLSFEDMNLGQSLPTPPPELLAEPPQVLNLPEYDKKTLL